LAVDKGSKNRPGIDLRAEIETVLGFYETSLRSVAVTMQKRAGKMIQLDASGLLAGNKRFEAAVRPESSRPRALVAKAADAGQVFKLVGFYPHAVGGEMNLEVNLEGQGAAERTGLLTASRFYVLGDAVTVKTDNEPGSRRTRKGSELREKFEFNTLRAPFEVGHGQFVMHEAAIRGVLVSAHMSGKVDFRQQALDIGGTYVPMSGLMRVPAEIPIFGPLLTGPRGEGLFGITFGIKGSMARPQVIVNPLSLITPGIFREVFQMTPEDLRIIPRERPAPPRKDGSRASSAPAVIPSGGASAAPAVTPEVGGSWSAEASQPPQPKRR
jgi:hypothetical protein